MLKSISVRHLRPVTAVALGTALVLLVACEIVSISGPSAGTVGDTLTYEVVVEHGLSADISDAIVWLMVDFPAAWSLAGASYAGTVDGGPVGGTPDQATPTAFDPGNCFTDAPPAGYQRAFFSAGPFPQVVQFDQGTLSVDLATAGAPGDFTLRFRAATEEEGDPSQLICPTDDSGDAPATETYEVTLAAPAVTEVPTLGTWGVCLLALLLGAAGLRRLAA